MINAVMLSLAAVACFAFWRFLKSIDVALHNATVEQRKENSREFAPGWIDVKYASARNKDEHIYFRHSLILPDGGDWKAEAEATLREPKEFPEGNLLAAVAYRIEDEFGQPKWRNV